MTSHSSKTVRCAIYTRVSTEVNRAHGEATMVCDVLRNLGLTLSDFDGVDDYDRAELVKCLAEGDAEDRAQVKYLTI